MNHNLNHQQYVDRQSHKNGQDGRSKRKVYFHCTLATLNYIDYGNTLKIWCIKRILKDLFYDSENWKAKPIDIRCVKRMNGRKFYYKLHCQEDLNVLNKELFKPVVPVQIGLHGGSVDILLSHWHFLTRHSHTFSNRIGN